MVAGEAHVGGNVTAIMEVALAVVLSPERDEALRQEGRDEERARQGAVKPQSRRTVVVDDQGRRQTWTAHYKRYFVDYDEKCDSLQEAAGFLMSGEDEGALSSVSIVGPDGVTVWDYTSGMGLWELYESLGGES